VSKLSRKNRGSLKKIDDVNKKVNVKDNTCVIVEQQQPASRRRKKIVCDTEETDSDFNNTLIDREVKWVSDNHRRRSRRSNGKNTGVEDDDEDSSNVTQENLVSSTIQETDNEPNEACVVKLKTLSREERAKRHNERKKVRDESEKIVKVSRNLSNDRKSLRKRKKLAVIEESEDSDGDQCNVISNIQGSKAVKQRQETRLNIKTRRSRNELSREAEAGGCGNREAAGDDWTNEEMAKLTE